MSLLGTSGASTIDPGSQYQSKKGTANRPRRQFGIWEKYSSATHRGITSTNRRSGQDQWKASIGIKSKERTHTIAMVQQGMPLLSTTVRNNLSLFDPHISDKNPNNV